ncbi:Inherit from KOG: thymidylate kinase [Seminavis robusta]|uniref:dTMP kinase n=1 Tax=Seminavis robusta TaxID=568900 RepID=A0A9N8DI14_9STRA|nr:Inherit from KOG: thymidylate kinase [Seminavis robusta]|eukprot:Sro98_g050250.1 Inherit from KOG: thymidylate kinase (822) ;mRNA; f:7846-10311
MADSAKLDAAYSRAVPHSIEGLYNFHAAATILRISHALGELDASVILQSKKDNLLQSFFDRLNDVEQSLAASIMMSKSATTPPSYAIHENASRRALVIVVEGLDGSGKSSLVDRLAYRFNNKKEPSQHAVAMATPTESMNAVRPVFDKRGGPVARAFYMVSNYILQYEITLLEQEHQQEPSKGRLVVVVDRWYTSTVAYSCAWKNTTGAASSIDSLASGPLFSWPVDLRAPDVLFLLQVEDSVRRERVQSRRQKQQSTPDSFNPWDQRLDDDPQLGERIMRGLERVGESLVTKRGSRVISLNANQSQQQVLEDAMQHVHQVFSERPIHPLSQFKRQPLACFQWVSSELSLCDRTTGRRGKHAPWAFQIAWNNNPRMHHHHSKKISDAIISPVLKTVGIHSVNETGILFFMRSLKHDSTAAFRASMVWNGGEYPYEQQWRGEGMIVPLSWSECEFLDTLPPPSLVAYTTACEECDEGNDMKSHLTSKQSQRLRERAMALRKTPPPSAQQETVLQGFRFVPLRMEVLAGGPSSPGGPLRYEWNRGLPDKTLTDPDEEQREEKHGWRPSVPILPFRAAKQHPQQNNPLLVLKPITVAITGTHCAGKTTLCEKLADILDAALHLEQGEILRDTDALVPGGHRHGDGSASSSSAASWDDRVFEAEVARDGQRFDAGYCRIVETWHVGNLAWALLRLQSSSSTSDDKSNHQTVLWERTKAAIESELSRRCVMSVHLSIGPDDSLRRRQQEVTEGVGAKSRLPMKNESEEVGELHQMLDVGVMEHMERLQRDLQIPTLTIDNSNDTALEATARSIIHFINQNQWRRAY